jgi:hypothetical protein
MSDSTIHSYLTNGGFSSKKMRRKKSGYNLSSDLLVEMAFDWVKKHWKLLTAGEIWSIDCTLTGHRLETWRSYSPSGAPPPLLDLELSRFTNLVVTAISSLGRMYYSIVFTYNAAARRDRKKTARRDAQVALLDAVLDEFSVQSYRVVYIGKEKDEKRTYVAASAEVVQMFLSKNNIEKGSFWMSDNGNEFFSANGSVLERSGVTHIAYPPAVHQYLSPNDNNHHSSAKAKWRTMGIDWSDDIRASVALLKCFDNDQANIRGYFEKNMQCERNIPDIEDMRELIGGKSLTSTSYHKKCMYEYCVAFKKDGRGGEADDYSDHLDGLYWQ